MRSLKKKKQRHVRGFVIEIIKKEFAMGVDRRCCGSSKFIIVIAPWVPDLGASVLVRFRGAAAV
jgi:hypothetical protein